MHQTTMEWNAIGTLDFIDVVFFDQTGQSIYQQICHSEHRSHKVTHIVSLVILKFSVISLTMNERVH